MGNDTSAHAQKKPTKRKGKKKASKSGAGKKKSSSTGAPKSSTNGSTKKSGGVTNGTSGAKMGAIAEDAEDDTGLDNSFGFVMDKKLTINDFTFLKVVGKGSFGKVMQVRKNDDGKIYALKVLKKKELVKRKQVNNIIYPSQYQNTHITSQIRIIHIQ